MTIEEISREESRAFSEALQEEDRIAKIEARGYGEVLEETNKEYDKDFRNLMIFMLIISGVVLGAILLIAAI